MTTGIRGDHLARLQNELKSSSDRIYELERRLGVKQTGLRRANKRVPAASVYRTTNQAIPDSVETTIVFNAKRWDTEGIWDSGSGLVCRTPGLYLISASVMWAYESSGTRVLHILVNSTVIIDDHNAMAQRTAQNFGVSGMSAARSWRLNRGDVVTVTVLQQTETGMTLNVLASPAFSPELGIARLGA